MRHPLAQLAGQMPWSALEPVIGHLKQEHWLERCRLKGAQGDALNAIGAAADYNLRWLMRWIAFLCAWLRAVVAARLLIGSRLVASPAR